MNTSASSAAGWLEHPLAGALMRFNLFPSMGLHASRASRMLPAGLSAAFEAAGAASGLHRHWSAALLGELGLAPITQLTDAALPLAMLPPPAFESLVCGCGLVVLGPSIRKTIARTQVQLLEQQLGADHLRFARLDAPRIEAGDESTVLEHGRAEQQVCLLGGAVLAAAFEAADEPVQRRGVLRLSEAAVRERAKLPPRYSQSRQALALARGVLEFQDPIWLSSFPANP